MIFVIIFAALVVAGIICCIVYSKSDCSDVVFGVGLSFVIVFGLVLFVLSGCIIGVQVEKDVDYQNMLYRKEILEYRIEHMEDNVTGNEMLYNDIVEFNNELRGIKKWASNPWTNWFNNGRIATIDYIELKGLNGD